MALLLCLFFIEFCYCRCFERQQSSRHEAECLSACCGIYYKGFYWCILYMYINTVYISYLTLTVWFTMCPIISQNILSFPLVHAPWVFPTGMTARSPSALWNSKVSSMIQKCGCRRLTSIMDNVHWFTSTILGGEHEEKSSIRKHQHSWSNQDKALKESDLWRISEGKDPSRAVDQSQHTHYLDL